MIRTIFLLAALFVIQPCYAQFTTAEAPAAANLKSVDRYTLASPRHLINEIGPRGKDGTLNVVVEIPAGTNAKWEVDKKDGHLKWEFKKGKPRVVKFLPYPANYGMIPGTLLSEEVGGDKDPLDVLVLGPALKRGKVVGVRLIGVLKMLDGGEKDDKLVAVLPASPLAEARSLDEMRNKFPGVLQILEVWMTSYKGPGEIESEGYGDQAEAESVVQLAISEFEKQKAAAR